MSDQSPQEPTMEEILASIRRIISEDDAPAEAAAAPEPEPAPVEEAPPRTTSWS
jgi:cell pole-organizing protein PopZ